MVTRWVDSRYALDDGRGPEPCRRVEAQRTARAALRSGVLTLTFGPEAVHHVEDCRRWAHKDGTRE